MDICQNFSMPKIPFTLIKPDQCITSEDFNNVHKRLNRLCDISGLALCTGEAGSGKTSAVSAWCETLNPNSTDIYWIEDAGRSIPSFFKRIIRAMNVESAHLAEKNYQKLIDAIEQRYSDTRKKQIFVIDEAQQLPFAILEQIRFLTNLGQKHPVPLSVILIAHRDILFTLKQHTMTPLRRRIITSTSMEGLTRDEVGSYLNHHIKIAGGPDNLFDKEVSDPIFNQSRGILRLINKIALSSLYKAAEKQQTKVTALEITEALNDWSEIEL